jgi:diguanylate cyclase (GGDEF)-like protein
MGPVLIGAIFVGTTVNAVNQSRERDRLDVATSSLRTAIGATCGRLQETAETAAAATVGGTTPDVAQTLVDQGRATAIHVENAAGDSLATTAGAPDPPWALCKPLPASAGIPAYDPDVDGAYTALAAAVEMRDQHGAVIGYAYAAQTLSPAFVRSLSDASGVQITVMTGSSAAMSTQTTAAAGHIATYAAGLAGDHAGKDRGRYVRRLDPVADEPLSIAMSVQVTTSGGMFAIVAAVIVFAALAAIGAAWALARTTTRPLDEIARAAEAVADGDLDTRVPVRHNDEVGHVGAALNRMSREMQTYVSALTASRGQLRGNLDVLGDTLSSTHDLPRILHVILASAISATSAQAGVVLLADPGDGMLRPQCSEGFDPTETGLLESLAIAPGEGLTGSVASTGVARRGRMSGLPVDAPADWVLRAATVELPRMADGEPGYRTYLAVPLRPPTAPGAAPAPIVGVLALYDRIGGDDFDDTDLRTVRTFAGHAAVAVDNVRAHDEAQRLSHTDPLTGLYNYRHLKDMMRREINRSNRFGHPLCVIVMDLDRFKEVNDTYGHPAGDAVLVEFARLVGAEIRGVDLAFRYGGEEFVLLLPETDGLGGITLAQRLGTAVRESTVTVTGARSHADGDTVQVGEATISITVSIGVAVFPDHGTSGAQVLEAADDALYTAKAAGRDTYRLAVVRSAARPAAAPGQEAAVPETDGPEAEDAAPAAVGGPIGSTRVAGRSRAPRGSGRPRGGASGGPQPPRQTRGR